METIYNSQSEVASHTEVPFEARHAVIEQMKASEQADIKQTGEQASTAIQIRQEHREQIQKIMGADKYEQLRAYIAEQKQNQAKSMLPPHGPDMSIEELAKLDEKRKKEALTYIRELGVNVNQLKALGEQTRKRLADLVPPAPTEQGKPVILVLPDDVPSDIRAGKANPWTIVHPPYPGWAWSYNGWLSGFSFSPALFLNQTTGLVGNSDYLSDSDASDADVGYIEYLASVGFWYQMPSTGLVEVWIEGQSGSSHHHLSLWDEWGWSDSSTYQRNYLTLKATGSSTSELRRSQMSWFYETGYTDGYWDNHYLTDGNIYWAHLFSDISFAAGSWVYVEVGMRNWNYCYANDVEVYSDVNFKWFIKSVWVESTGG